MTGASKESSRVKRSVEERAKWSSDKTSMRELQRAEALARLDASSGYGSDSEEEFEFDESVLSVLAPGAL